MPYFRVIILMQGGAKRQGIRHFDLGLDYETIRESIWAKLDETVPNARQVIVSMTFEKLPVDHPEVVHYILHRK